MPPSNQRKEWPDIDVNSDEWQMTSEPPIAFQSENGKSFIDYRTKIKTGTTYKIEYYVGTTVSGLDDVLDIGVSSLSLAKLWSTGLWGLVYNDATKVYSAVKLFRADLATSQDSLESSVPYMFCNKWDGKYTPPYNITTGFRFLFITNKRSPYKYKTSAQMQDWIKERRKDTTPGFDLTQTGIDRFGSGPSITTSTSTNHFYDLKVNDYLTLRMPFSSHPFFNANWPQRFASAVIDALKEKGISSDDIRQFGQEYIQAAIRAINGSPGSGSTNIAGGSSGSSRGIIPPSNIPETPVNLPPIEFSTRLPSGGRLVNIEAMSKRDPSTIKPQIRQAFINNVGETEEESFYFDYIPATVSYTLGGSTWNEIPRTLDSPLMEWTSQTLTRVQMSFLIAGDRLEQAFGGTRSVPDGLEIDVEERIRQIRRIASRPSPVFIYGLDDIFNIHLHFAQSSGEPCAWAVADLAITAKRRTGGCPSLISVAQVNISFIQMPIENAYTMRLPKLELQPTTPTAGSSTGSRTPIRPDLWTEYLAKPLPNSLLIQT